MKPTFALDLTRESIALLHRTPKGWLSIGETAFDAPDMAEALDYLRKTALGLSPMGMATKIVLPNSQILYAEIEAPGPSRREKRRQIAAALEGQTPYAVDDLFFDWSGKGTILKVAIVARETLAEAEAFAVEHRLNPVSFVAMPEEGDFVGEPWFGPTAASENVLAPGESVDRDRDAIVVLHRDLPGAAAPAAKVDDDEPLPGLEEALNADVADDETARADQAEEVAAPEPLADAVETIEDEAISAPEPLAPEPEIISDPEPELSLLADAADTAAADEMPVIADMPTALEQIVEEPAREADAITIIEAPAEFEVPTAPNRLEVEEAPFAHVTDTAAFPDSDDQTPAAVKRIAADELDTDVPPVPPSAAMMAFASRRASGGPIPAPIRPVDGATRSDAASPAISPPVSRVGIPPLRPAPAKGLSGPVTAPTIPGARPKPKGKFVGADIARPTAPGPTMVKSPARPGGTFGTTAPPRNRTGVVFMVLVALLLLFLALVAAWSSFYLARSGEPETDPAQAALEAVSEVDDEMLADMQDPEGMTDPLPEAADVAAAPDDVGELATESAPVNIGGDETATTEAPSEPAVADATEPPAADATVTALQDPAPADDATTLPEAPTETAGVEPAPEPAPQPAAEPAPGTVVATELTAAQPPAEDQDEIFLSAMDAPPPALDALALPAPPAAVDVAPDPVMPPPVFGTVYEFGADGLLKATPEGIVSPNGVMLIAGAPPLLPPSRSEAATAAALAAVPVAAPVVPEGTDPALVDPAAPPAAGAPTGASLVTAGEGAGGAEIAPAPADPAMAGFRPRPRPEGLAPASDDDAGLVAEDATDFVDLRPLPRPASVLAAASASRPASGEPTDLGAQRASLTAQAEAELAAAEALEAQNPSIVAISKRPESRPRDLSRAVEAAVAAAVREPEPEVTAAAAAPELKPEEQDEADEPETATAAPKIPTKASVAKQATYVNAINLSKVNLIGTYGTDSRRTALIRQSNGRYKKVKVGDRIDGGTVKAITETEVRYQKGGKLLTLKMPKA